MSVIHFLNVKEGDCIWIKHNCGHNTMIDISNAKAIEENQEGKMENLRRATKQIRNEKLSSKPN